MDNKKSHLSTFLLVGVLAFIVLSIVLVLAGYLVVAWKQPQQKVIITKNVCDETIVSKFNKVTEDNLSSLASEIKAKNGYQSDATCQTILIVAAIQTRNSNDAKRALEEVKSLQKQHIYANSELNIGLSLNELETAVNDISQSNQNSTKEDQKGGA